MSMYPIRTWKPVQGFHIVDPSCTGAICALSDSICGLDMDISVHLLHTGIIKNYPGVSPHVCTHCSQPFQQWSDFGQLLQAKLLSSQWILAVKLFSLVLT